MKNPSKLLEARTFVDRFGNWILKIKPLIVWWGIDTKIGMSNWMNSLEEWEWN